MTLIDTFYFTHDQPLAQHPLIMSHHFHGPSDPGHDACGVGFLADRQGRSRFDLLPLALKALARLNHRGGVGADGETGDGAGVLTAIPWALLVAEPGNGIDADMAEAGCGVGALFLATDRLGRERDVESVEAGLHIAGLSVLAWREVPTNNAVLGRLGRASRPGLFHIVVSRPEGLSDEAYEHRLFVGRREIEGLARQDGSATLYVASLSHRTIVYKALVRGAQLREFYQDLRSREFRTSFAVFHNRFSTNTEPAWRRAQPFRLLAHNGEINTIEGNRRWMEARGHSQARQALGLSPRAATPLLPLHESDSASLDEALRLLTAAGHASHEAIAMLIPPAWENDPRVPLETRRFYEAAVRRMEPWDGPAMIGFGDGRIVGAVVDRNGLRPARTVMTREGLVMVASEAGVLDVPDHEITHRGRLGPGGFLAVDLERGGLIDRDALERLLAESPLIDGDPAQDVPRGFWSPSGETETGAQVLSAFGYTREELQFVIGPMAREAAEPIGSMGDDAPLACLSEKPRLLFSFFKQRFAQVTNPALDPLREPMVMSLAAWLGPRPNALLPGSEEPAPWRLEAPLLTETDLDALTPLTDENRAGVSLLFTAAPGVESQEMERALNRVLLAAVREVRGGACRLILSDRGIDEKHAAIPSLLAVSAVHQRLIREGLRLKTSLIVETGDARDDHQIAALLAYGADALCPYGLYAATRRWAAEIDKQMAPAAALRNVTRAIEKGLLKILSKMGIATLRSYQGAQLFEAIGLDRGLVARHFTGTPCRLEGHGLVEIARDVLDRHTRAFASESRDLEEGGAHRYRRNDEAHAYEPPVIKALHTLIRTGKRLDSRAYSRLVEQRAPIAVRDLLRFRETGVAEVALDQVEPASALFPRFSTAAMSLGSLSPEAHTALAVAMNRIGASSNSGEGGEPLENYWRDLPGGDHANHRIKQVASARFGVTTDYLVSADELQIKIAQGSKPGEGGQLPGRKVVAHIARVRHSPPGVTLISPPPHHDIYSIEDLAQLIHDLKSVNPKAAISVKLVSASGIGTIAAGVVKAGADTVVIGGHDGGTGASPLSSIKNAGSPWELGLMEIQSTLVEQGLRDRVRLRVEGGLKTGRDVVMAAAMGADEFAFGSAALVAAGCVMARQCHLNTCPAGIATQREELRRKFRGTPEQAIRFFNAVAEEAREILGTLGRHRLQDVIGDLSVLEARPFTSGSRLARVSAAELLAGPRSPHPPGSEPHVRNEAVAASPGPDDAVIARLTRVNGHVARLSVSRPITVADRSVGARVAGELARGLRGRRLSEGTIRLHFRGAAGQSFGAFAVAGMSLILEGEANDYVGKGLSGGEIVLRPRRDAWPAHGTQVIAGNTLLYGATSGRLFAAGQVGERFAVRLSGALAVVEGAGDHACEYMTAGTVAILGPVGRNLGAGMSGGLAYVYDPESRLAERVNHDLVEIGTRLTVEDREWLREACRRHWEATASPVVERLLSDWKASLGHFRKVAPRDLAAVQPCPWPEEARTSEPWPEPLWSVA